MARFADDRALYGSLGRLFRDALDDERASGRVRKADACLQLRFRDPDAVVTALLRGSQSQVDFGPSRLRPDATIAMDGDVGHAWLVGELNPTTALSDGRIKTRGPSAVVLNALALVKSLAPVYQGILEAAGEELPESLDASLLPDPPKAAAPAQEVAAEVVTEGSAGGEEAAPAEVVSEEAPAAEAAEPEADPAPEAEVSGEEAPAEEVSEEVVAEASGEEGPADAEGNSAELPEAEAPEPEAAEPAPDPAPEAEVSGEEAPAEEVSEEAVAEASGEEGSADAEGDSAESPAAEAAEPEPDPAPDPPAEAEASPSDGEESGENG